MLEESNQPCYKESMKNKNKENPRKGEETISKSEKKTKLQMERQRKNPRLQQIIENLRARLTPSSAPARCNSSLSTSAIGGVCT